MHVMCLSKFLNGRYTQFVLMNNVYIVQQIDAYIVIIQKVSITHLSELEIKRESKLLIKKECSVFKVLENKDSFLVIFHSLFERENRQHNEEQNKKCIEDKHQQEDDSSSIDSYEYKKDMESDIESEEEQQIDEEEYVDWNEVYDLVCEYKEYESDHLTAILY